MTNKKINITKQGTGAMVWKLNSEGVAIAADVLELGHGWQVLFQKEKTFFFDRPTAIKFAIKWVKAAI